MSGRGKKSKSLRLSLRDSGYDDGSDLDDGDGVFLIGNHIYFYDSVSTASFRDFMKCLHHLVHTEDLDEIILHIKSDGGDTYIGLAMYDIIRGSSIPITGIVEGSVASSATLMLMGCSKRQMTTSSYLLIHQLSSDFEGKFKDWKDEHDHMKQLMTQLKSIYILHTKLKESKIEDLLSRELMLNARQCRRYGFIDDII
jgi:ATP-dependent protease ClpP protease subunit